MVPSLAGQSPSCGPAHGLLTAQFAGVAAHKLVLCERRCLSALRVEACTHVFRAPAATGRRR
eukprot:9212129-Alexandrium_andersonii.AAC.1